MDGGISILWARLSIYASDRTLSGIVLGFGHGCDVHF